MRAGCVDPRIVKTHSDVLACAWTLLLERGWESVTVTNVAERSGYARSTLYRHWPNRLDLLRELISEQARSSHTKPSGHTRNDLIAELEAFQNAITSTGLGTILAAIAHLTGSDRESATMAQATWADEVRVLSSVLQSARANWEIPPEVTDQDAIDMLVGPIIHRFLCTSEEPGRDQVTNIVDSFLAAMEQRLRCRQPDLSSAPNRSEPAADRAEWGLGR